VFGSFPRPRRGAAAFPPRTRGGLNPPRRYDDLQRLTTRRIRSSGFAEPPSPFLSCDLDPGVFRRVAPRLVSRPSEYRSWPFVRPRGSLPLRGPYSRSSDDRRPVCPSILPWSSSPLRRSQLEESTSRRSRPGTTEAVPGSKHLVAGFHTRFGPPSPFSTTLTVCSSSNPVVCFDHSRPWGSVSPLPA
jgi:hypothetical protein